MPDQSISPTTTRELETSIDPSNLLQRRAFLKMTGLLVGGAALAAPANAMAFFWNFRIAGPSTEIDERWVKEFGRDVSDYVVFLERLRLKHIKVGQIIEAHIRQRGNVKNSLPPKNMWKNCRSTFQAADALCEEVGEPIRRIVSAYRSPAYNARCPGARPGSFHTRNMALDLQFRSSPRTVAAAARKIREQGSFKGGVGRYSSFTHIDTRGRNADW